MSDETRMTLLHSNTNDLVEELLMWRGRAAELLDRIAELEAENGRLKSCESALISIVNQFFHSRDGDNILFHAFMSAEEEAADYLVEHGIARWADERKCSICLKEVEE